MFSRKPAKPVPPNFDEVPVSEVALFARMLWNFTWKGVRIYSKDAIGVWREAMLRAKAKPATPEDITKVIEIGLTFFLFHSPFKDMVLIGARRGEPKALRPVEVASLLAIALQWGNYDDVLALCAMSPPKEGRTSVRDLLLGGATSVWWSRSGILAKALAEAIELCEEDFDAWLTNAPMNASVVENIAYLCASGIAVPENIREACVYICLRHPHLHCGKKVGYAALAAKARDGGDGKLTQAEMDIGLTGFIRNLPEKGVKDFPFFLKAHRAMVSRK